MPRHSLVRGSRRGAILSAAIASATVWTLSRTVHGDVSFDPNWGTTTWSNPAAWLGPVPNAVGEGTIFRDVSASERNIGVDGNFTIGGMVFSSTQGGSWTFTSTGTNKLTIDAGPGNTSLISTTKTEALINSPVILNSNAVLTNGSAGSSYIKLAGALSGGGDLTVNAFSRLDILGNNSTWNGALHLNVGAITVNTSNVLGTVVGATYVDSTELTSLRIAANVLVKDDIYLNNARGMGYAGAITGLSGSNQRSIITGRVDLGSNGAFISGGSSLSNSGIYIKGEVSGGTLNVVGGVVGVAANNNTFTGALRAQSGTTKIVDDGVVTTASQVIVHQGAEVLLDNSGTATLTNRLADSIPITLNGGAIRLVAGNSDVTETIGNVIVAMGAGHIRQNRRAVSSHTAL